MNPYIQSLKDHLASQTPDYGDGDISSLLEFLWMVYTDRNPVKSGAIRKLLLRLEPYHEALPPQGG